MEVKFKEEFKEKLYKIRDKAFYDRIVKAIEKIKNSPEIGKPMRYGRIGTRETYTGSYRLAYAYIKKEQILIFLDIYHKDEQ